MREVRDWDVILALALVSTFVLVVLTGPVGLEWRARRRARLDRPMGRVVYLPLSACRGHVVGCRCPEDDLTVEDLSVKQGPAE